MKIVFIGLGRMGFPIAGHLAMQDVMSQFLIALLKNLSYGLKNTIDHTANVLKIYQMNLIWLLLVSKTIHLF